MYKFIFSTIFCLLAITMFGQKPSAPKAPTIDPKYLQSIPKVPIEVFQTDLNYERIPFFNSWSDFVKCGGDLKLIGFQVTFIDTKDVPISGCNSFSDPSNTYYYAGDLDITALKNLPTQLKTTGRINRVIANYGAYSFSASNFSLYISTMRSIGTVGPYDLTIKIDGVGSIPMKYQCVGNNTLYANNGKQTIIITLGRTTYTVPN
jgi:hypothetical protein